MRLVSRAPRHFVFISSLICHISLAFISPDEAHAASRLITLCICLLRAAFRAPRVAALASPAPFPPLPSSTRSLSSLFPLAVVPTSGGRSGGGGKEGEASLPVHRSCHGNVGLHRCRRKAFSFPHCFQIFFLQMKPYNELRVTHSSDMSPFETICTRAPDLQVVRV